MVRRSKTWLAWLIGTGILSLSVLVPLGYQAMPGVYRWVMLRRLTDDDAGKRHEAINYITRELQRSEPDPKVLPGVLEQLEAADDEVFLELVQALDYVGQWAHPPVSDASWLRWLATAVHDSSPKGRQIATRYLARLPDLADDERVLSMVDRLANDVDETVRYQALIAAGELYGAAHERKKYESIIAARTEDPAATVARQAWLFMGLINPSSGISSQWRGRPTPVAEAMLWAALRTNPDVPTPAIEALTDSDADASLRAMAAYALGYSKADPARDALVAMIEAEVATPTPTNQAIVWRAILAVPIDESKADDRAARALVKYRDRPLNDPLFLSAAFRVGAVAPVLELKRPELPEDANPDDVAALMARPEFVRWSQLNMVALAKFEGIADSAAPASARPPIQLTDALQPAAQLAALAATAAPNPTDFVPFMRSPIAAVRDRACVIAARRLTREQQLDLATHLLRDFNDDAKIAGAILAGLTGVRPTGVLAEASRPSTNPDGRIDLIEYWAEHGSSWRIQQMMNIALWMQGRPRPQAGNMDQTVPGMLAGDDDVWTTVLLALAHRHHPAAMRFLFATRDELSTDPLDLIVDPLELLDKFRWWDAIRPYMADDAPQFSVWADPALESFQVEVLRAWYLLHLNRPASLYRETDAEHGRG